MTGFQNVLVYLRDDSKSDAGLDRAADLARAQGAKVTVVRVIGSIPEHVDALLPGEWDLQALGKESAREQLEEIARPLRDSGLDVTTDILEGRPEVEITRRALRCRHDLVLKTAENEDSLLGTTAHRLMRVCPCPVWVVHPNQRKPYARLLAAVHPSTGNPKGQALQRKILDHALALRDRGSMKLDVVHVWRAHGEEFLSGRMRSSQLAIFLGDLRRDAESRMAKFLEDAGASVPKAGVHLRRGHPDEVIVAVAREVRAELLVLGTVARGGLSGFLIGNTAEKILRRADCSILAIKPDGFVSPIKL